MKSILTSISQDASFAQEKELNRGLESALKYRIRIKTDKTDTGVPFRERPQPLDVISRSRPRHPSKSCWIHDDRRLIAGLGKGKRFTHCLLETSRRTILRLQLPALVRVRVHPTFKCTLLRENGIRRLPLRNTEISAPAGTAELEAHYQQTFRSSLRSVVDALREVTNPALGQDLFVLVGIVALEHVTNLVKIVSMTRRRPPAGASAP